MAEQPTIGSIDDYIAGSSPEIQAILEAIRAIVREEAPEAKEKISYRMPAFTLNGALIYFAAFKQHIGIYPPVVGDEKLQAETARYKGEKGNLKFPLNEPMPYPLIRKVVQFRLAEHQARLSQKRSKK